MCPTHTERPRELAWLASCVLLAALAVCTVAWPTARGQIPPLDDTYIHFGYARSIDEGRPFVYSVGAAPSSGSTSPIYAVLLAAFHRLGWRGSQLMVPALAMGILSLGLASAWLSALAVRFAGEGMRVPVLLGILGWGWLLWHVASGMEGAIALAAMAFIFDAAHRWLHYTHARSWRLAVGLIGAAVLLPLVRPASMFLGVAVGMLLFAFPTEGRAKLRWLGVLSFGSLVVSRVFWQVTTGQTIPNGAAAKWLLVHPAKPTDEVVQWIVDNIERLASYLFGVGPRAERHYGAPLLFGTVVLAGLVWTLARARSRERAVWALFPLAIVAAFAGLMTYGTYGQHFFRYTTPYIPLLFTLGLVPVALVSRRFARRYSALGDVGLAVLGPVAVAASMLFTIAPARRAYEGSVRDIEQQHVSMARQVRVLPADSVIGVTDAGGLAYLGGHPTVDLVGLTTNGMAAYHLSGAGSQLESLEQLPRRTRPTHFVTYRGWWFRPSTLFGRAIGSARSTTITIAGGRTMELWRADEARLGLGLSERPVLLDMEDREIIDGLDVADIDDERAHDYRSSNAPADNVFGHLARASRPRLVEGGRREAVEETAALAARAGAATTLVARLSGPRGARVAIDVNGEQVSTWTLPGHQGWVELELELPRDLVRDVNLVRLRREGPPVITYHLWTLGER